MSKWELIERVLSVQKETFRKSYKCVNKNIFIKTETVRKHLKILISSLEGIREVVNNNFVKLTKEHQEQSQEVYWSLRDQLVRIFAKYNIRQQIPYTIEEPLKIDVDILLTSSETSKFDPILEGDSYSESDTELDDTMTQTTVEFLNTASKLIPDFDGKFENLRSFLDALSLVDTLKGSHEAVAISLIKTKLKGTARNSINDEASIQQIITKLSGSVKGESVEVLSAKILNIRQNNKSANAYCNEIETLTKSLEGAYISDGLTCEQATRYSTQVAVKAMTKNCTIDKVKLIMEAGQFGSMNEAIGKFVNSCTEATSQQNSILYFGRKPNDKHYRGNNKKFRGRGGYSGNRNDNQRSNRGNNRYYRRENNRSHGNHGRGNNVRMTTTDGQGSENPNVPLRASN